MTDNKNLYWFVEVHGDGYGEVHPTHEQYVLIGEENAAQKFEKKKQEILKLHKDGELASGISTVTITMTPGTVLESGEIIRDLLHSVLGENKIKTQQFNF